MKKIDRLLQDWRISRVVKEMPKQIRVIDLGAHEGELFCKLGANLIEGFGVEPLLKDEIIRADKYVIRKGYFPSESPTTKEWDCITMLAVLEHIPADEQDRLSSKCHSLLKAGGKVYITVPSALVDNILAVLRFFRLIDGMSLEEHWGFKPNDTARVFSPPQFKLISHSTFQLGLNHLFVFEKVSQDARDSTAINRL